MESNLTQALFFILAHLARPFFNKLLKLNLNIYTNIFFMTVARRAGEQNIFVLALILDYNVAPYPDGHTRTRCVLKVRSNGAGLKVS